jgi:hypothetical protein
MTDEEKNDSDKEKNCPLSPTDWILFLSGEIYNEENTNNQDSTTPTITLLVVVALSIIALIFAARTTNLPVNSINSVLSGLLFSLLIISIFIFSYLIYLIYRLLWVRPKTQKRVEALKKLRRTIIFGENDSYKIRKEWEKI